MEILWKGTVPAVSSDLTETLWNLCFSKKFPHQETRWNFRILRIECFVSKPHFPRPDPCYYLQECYLKILWLFSTYLCICPSTISVKLILARDISLQGFRNKERSGTKGTQNLRSIYIWYFSGVFLICERMYMTTFSEVVY